MLQGLMMKKKKNSLEQSPSQEANSSSASQDICCIVRNPQVHYCVHSSRLLVSTLSQTNPVHTLPFHSLRIILIVPPIYSMVYQVVSFLQLSLPQLCTHFSPPHVPHAPPISSSLISTSKHLVSSTNHAVSIVHCSVISTSFLLLRPKYLPQYPILKHPQALFFP